MGSSAFFLTPGFPPCSQILSVPSCLRAFALAVLSAHVWLLISSSDRLFFSTY